MIGPVHQTLSPADHRDPIPKSDIPRAHFRAAPEPSTTLPPLQFRHPELFARGTRSGDINFGCAQRGRIVEPAWEHGDTPGLDYFRQSPGVNAAHGHGVDRHHRARVTLDNMFPVAGTYRVHTESHLPCTTLDDE